MSTRIFNFSSGPAAMPLPVLERAREQMLSLDGSGMSVMEMSHRSDIFGEILFGAETKLRTLLNIPANYRVLFMQGGASLQFTLVPMNLLRKSGFAEYVTTGTWGEKAIAEARKLGDARERFTTKDTGFKAVPKQDDLSFDPDADYVHYCSNETIHGVEFGYDLDAGVIPVICDASSNILSKPIDVERYALIYAGAQKNLGPSGVTIVIIRDDMLERIPAGLPTMFDYCVFADNGSMPNTPNTWGVYLIGLVCDWLIEQGGVNAIAAINGRKSKMLYDGIDSSDGFYTGHATRDARSRTNVTFRLPDEKLEKQFCAEAEALGLNGLAGHRSVGGVRASIYNAFSMEGVEKLVEFMRDFSQNRER
jgi:phosphoserine aminotransferase